MRLLTEYLSTAKKPSKIRIRYGGDELRRIVSSEIERLGKDADLNHIDVSGIENFTRALYLKDFSGDISQWDMSNAVNTDSMFSGNIHFNPEYLGEWKFSEKLKDTNHMFAACHRFEGTGLRYWNVSSVENFDYMFVECKAFNEDISSWRPINAKSIEAMFKGTKAFDQDLSSWTITKYCNTHEAFKNSKMNRSLLKHPKHMK